jgi:hypothetical protein
MAKKELLPLHHISLEIHKNGIISTPFKNHVSTTKNSTLTVIKFASSASLGKGTTFRIKIERIQSKLNQILAGVIFLLKPLSKAKNESLK